MPCGCGKKAAGTIHFMGSPNSDTPDPVNWGPILWKYLHCLTEKIGMSGNIIVDIDQSNHIDTLIHTLHLILPCPECQAHTHAYISTNPPPSLKGLIGDNLRSILRNWLFTFHNNVRMSKNQPIIINTPEECQSHYSGCALLKCDYDVLVQNGAAAVQLGWVKIEHWRKWYTTSEKLRIITGNIIIN